MAGSETSNAPTSPKREWHNVFSKRKLRAYTPAPDTPPAPHSLVLVTRRLFLFAKLEVLAAGNNDLLLRFAFFALQPERHLLRRLRLQHDGSFRDGRSSGRLARV